MIMKKLIASLLLISIVFTRCKQDSIIAPSINFSGGPFSINGIAVLYDTLSGNYSFNRLSGVTVYIRYSSDTVGYLYPVAANSLGQYLFNGINNDSNYTIYCQKDSNGVKYYGENKYKAGSFTASFISDTLRLYPSSKNQNDIHLIVFDSAGGRVANVTAWVFTSPSAFQSSDSSGKNFNMTTNFYGVDNKLNNAPGYYYLRVKTKIGVDSVKGEDTVFINTSGIQNSVITLNKFPSNKNGFELYVTDIYGSPVNNASIYTYRSKSVFLADSTYQDTTSILKSDNNGKASNYNIAQGWYYFRVKKQIDSRTTLTAIDSLNIPLNGIQSDIIIINN